MFVTSHRPLRCRGSLRSERIGVIVIDVVHTSNIWLNKQMNCSMIENELEIVIKLTTFIRWMGKKQQLDISILFYHSTP